MVDALVHFVESCVIYLTMHLTYLGRHYFTQQNEPNLLSSYSKINTSQYADYFTQELVHQSCEKIHGVSGFGQFMR